MKSVSELYKYHSENLRTVDIAIKRIALAIRSAISKAEEKQISSLLRMYMLLLATWIECRLNKLLYEQNGFQDKERRNIISHKTHLGRWQNTVDIAFCKHHRIKKITLLKTRLPHSALARYSTICDMLNKEIAPIIEVRNKLAHGQWAYQLNKKGDDVSQRLMRYMKTENFLSLQFKRELVKYLIYVINDLVVSGPTFERDFDKNYQLIEETRRNLTNRSYESYVIKMRHKYHNRR